MALAEECGTTSLASKPRLTTTVAAEPVPGAFQNSNEIRHGSAGNVPGRFVGCYAVRIWFKSIVGLVIP